MKSILVSVVFLLGFVSLGQAQTASGSVDPNSVTAELGDTFTVTVNIDPNGSAMTVAQIAMRYDPAIVEVTSLSLVSGSPLGVSLPGTVVDNTEGFFFIAGFGFSPPTGSFSQVQIEFSAIGAGTSTLEFEREGLLNTLFSEDGSDITGILEDGEIIVGGVMVDCPNLGLNIGDACDDGDSDTEDDTVLADCSCQGTPICQAPFPGVDESSLNLNVGATTVDFAWDAVPGQIGCQVQVIRILGSTNQRQSFITLEEDFSSLSLNKDLILPGVQHAWRVRCGCSRTPIIAGPFTPWQPFMLPSEIVLTSSPNPTKDYSNVQFELKTESQVTLEVYDMNGRLVEQVFSGMASASTPYRFQFDGSDLSQGIYIYRLTTQDEVINEKFMITK